MNISFGFKNFRKFENLPDFKLNEISILVGPNGSGKSSFTKALLLAYTNIKDLLDSGCDFDSEGLPIFKFSPLEYRNIHVGLFSRALFNQAQERSIEFTLEKDNVRYKLEVDSASNSSSGNLPEYAVISQFDICWLDDCYLSIDYKRKMVTYWGPKNPYSFAIETEFDKEIVEESVSFPKYCSFSDIWDSLYSSLKHKRLLVSDEKLNLVYSDSRRIKRLSQTHKNHIISNFRMPIEYLQTHTVSQKAIYSIDDKNDYLAQTIHEFFTSNAFVHSDIHDFVKEWMKKLGIGGDYIITSYEGEAYSFDVLSDGARMPLADKGVGQIQMMILLMRLGIVMKKRYVNDLSPEGGFNYQQDCPLIIVEEPEQNMHPEMQSKLADLFYKANDGWNIQFLIETHSEYIVRRTQVMVAAPDNQVVSTKSPFGVWYFPGSKIPYKMEYQDNGLFFQKFGKGFFDESGSHHIELIKFMNRQ